MPEEKKDSFTFSDKIKNSKPVPSKSFANRTSKLGSNGKPKKTIFERTKRDAPFFIAALVALLLLPFLYKYSGQVEEQTFVTPGVDQDFVADYDYLPGGVITDNPDGEVAKYAGRDSIGLIAGMGGAPDSGMPPSMDSIDRNGLDDDYPSYTPPVDRGSSVRNQRQQAAPQTRGAFRRATQTPTKIGTLGNASMAGRSGSLAVGSWGGALKESAARVRNSGPKQGPKPVSLQPLQAAGKPSRSYFGVGNAKQARDSKDALSKGNALQALKDAQFNPINPGVIGGISGADGQRGGGNANMPNSGAFKGMKPWWWDLMAQRSQHDWLWKRNLWQKPITMLVEAVAKGLADMFAGLLGCLFTGEDDWSMGSMWGTSEGSASQEGCKCNKTTYTSAEQLLKDAPNVSIVGRFDKWCKNEKGGGALGCEWVDAKGAGGNLNWFQKRLHCMGATVKSKGKKSISLDEVSSCHSLQTTGKYQVAKSSGMEKWGEPFHYVVALPVDKIAAYQKATTDSERINLLQVIFIEKGNNLYTESPELQARYIKSGQLKYIPMFVESIAFKKKVGTEKQGSDSAAIADGLVLGVKKVVKPSNNDPDDIYYTSKKSKTEKAALPMSYTDFKNIFESGAKLIGKPDKEDKWMKVGRQGKDWVVGAQCEFPLVQLICPMGTMTRADATEKPVPYATLALPGVEETTLQNAVSSGNVDSPVWNFIRDRISLWYAIATVDSSGTISYPNSMVNGITKANHFSAKRMDNARNPAIRAHYAQGTLQAIDVPILAQDAVKVNGKNKMHIKWYIVQGDGVNAGAAGSAVEDFDLANVVSTRECPYYDYEDNGTDSSNRPPEVKCPDGQHLNDQGECEDDDDDDDDDGNGGGNTIIHQTLSTLNDRFTCPGNHQSAYRINRGGVAGISPGQKGLQDLLKESEFACDECKQEFGRHLTAYINSTASTPVTETQVTAYLSGHQLKMGAYLQALYEANGSVTNKSACWLASQIAGWSLDPTANDPRIQNTFGTFAVYLSQTASAFYPRPKVTLNNQEFVNPAFNYPDASGDRNRGVQAIPGYTYQGSVIENDYLYSRYPAAKETSDTVKGPFPLGGLVSNSTMFPVYYTRGGAAGAAYREAYDSNYEPLFRDCSRVTDGNISHTDIKQYIDLVCERGLQYKPKSGGSATNWAALSGKSPAPATGTCGSRSGGNCP